MLRNICLFCLAVGLVPMARAQNDVMLQAFYWDVPVDETSLDGTWWNNLEAKAEELKQSGITAIWTPVPCKGNWGITDNGYGIYDHYDLGNYLQKGSVETRFGSRSELESMIAAMHREPAIDVYSDVVLNHLYSSEENAQANPAVKAYVFGEADGENFMPYPSNEIKWIIPDAPAGEYLVQIKGYCLPWQAAKTERGYDVTILWDDSPVTGAFEWEEEPNDGNGSFNVFPGSGKIMRAYIDSKTDIDEYLITLTSAHDIEISIAAKKESGNPVQWVDAGPEAGLYPCAVWHDGENYAIDKMFAYTNTAINYPLHTGKGEPNYSWDYSHFHPCDTAGRLGAYGTDEIVPDAKFFGNDLNTFDPEVQSRLCDWGKWLVGTIGFDGFRLDFVRGFQEEFVARWVNSLPLVNGSRPFIVGEYWGADHRIKNWVNTVASMGAVVKGFDFPLKNTLTDMCNSPGCDFDMSCLNHAGMVRNDKGNSLPATSVVTFLENHDTGKEHDKWVTKDYHLGYAYILTHEGRPCIFYPHFFGDTQHDANDKSKHITAPRRLHESIRKLIEVRKTYLGGRITVLSENGAPCPAENCGNLYIARRQGNGIKDGAIIAINNSDEEYKAMCVTVNASGFADWADKTLVNVLDTAQTAKIGADGRVEIGAPSRDYSIWVLQSDLE